MQTENRFFEDFAKVANGIAGTFAGMGREAETNARERVREWLGGGADQVGREEFEAVKAMAAAARDEADTLRARLDALAATIAALPATAAAASASAATAAPAAGHESPGGEAAPGVPTL